MDLEEVPQQPVEPQQLRTTALDLVGVVCGQPRLLGTYPQPHTKPHDSKALGGGYLPKPYKCNGVGIILQPKAYEYIWLRVEVEVFA